MHIYLREQGRGHHFLYVRPSAFCSACWDPSNHDGHSPLCTCPAALNFILRNQFARPEDVPGKEALPKEKLVEKVKYIPKNLEMERPDYVERLQFFKEPFMFARDQMTVFLKTLTDTVAGIFESDESGDGPGGEDEPIIVE